MYAAISSRVFPFEQFLFAVTVVVVDVLIAKTVWFSVK